MNDHSTTKPVDEGWVAHLRDLSTGVAPPTAANPHAMSRVAIRRTRTRRAVFATGGGVLTVAAVAGAAFALGGPTASGVLLPGGSPASPASSASADSSMSAEERQARALEAEVREALERAKDLPEAWHEHELEGLVYALPPEIVTSGPVQDEPGVTSDMWHSSADPDSPPFLRMAYYEDGSANPAWPDTADNPGGQQFEVPGAERATAYDVTALAAGMPEGDVADDEKGPTMLVLEPTSGAGAYVINLNLPPGTAKDFVKAFAATLTLD